MFRNLSIVRRNIREKPTSKSAGLLSPCSNENAMAVLWILAPAACFCICRTDGVEELHFGILRIDSSVLLGGEGQQIDARLILVMLAPMHCPPEHISVMGAISQEY